jgi:hypothetical protein
VSDTFTIFKSAVSEIADVVIVAGVVVVAEW